MYTVATALSLAADVLYNRAKRAAPIIILCKYQTLMLGDIIAILT